MKRILLSLTLLLVGVSSSYSQSVCFLPSACGVTLWNGGTITNPIVSPGATFTAPALFADGSATAPSIAFATSPTTGFYQNFAGQISYVTGSTAYWVFSGTTFKPQAADTNDFGTTQIRNLYLARSIQGSKSKALTDNTATAFATMAMPQTAGSNYGGGQMIYTIFCKDAANQAQQSGTVKFVCMNLAGTESCGFGTPDGVTLGDGTASLGTPVFTAAAGADLVTISVQSDCTGVTPTTHTIQVRFDLQQPNTLAFP